MNSHLAVRIDGHFAALPEDAAIDIEDSNPYFNDTPETWSYSFDLPLDGNEDLLGNIADIASDRRLVSMENKSMEVYAEGIEFRNGKVATTEDQEIKDKVSISMTSINKQLTDLFGDLSLRDIVFPDEDHDSLQIGEMIGELSVKGGCRYSVEIEATVENKGLDSQIAAHYDYENNVPNIVESNEYWIWMGIHNLYDVRISGERVVYPQALGFSTPREYAIDYGPGIKQYQWQVKRDANGEPVINKSFINVEAPYGTTITQPDGLQRKALYFNARVCYTHHALDTDGKPSDDVEFDNGGYGPYYVLDADRPQSGICFYVLYVIRSMFHTLGVTYGNAQEAVLMAVPDMCRLGFYTTLCKYDQVTYAHFENNNIDGSNTDFPYADNFDNNDVNLWLSERKTQGRLEPSKQKNDDAEDKPVVFDYYGRFQRRNGGWYDVVKEDKYIRTVTAKKGESIPVELYNIDTRETKTLDFKITRVIRVDKGDEYQYSARIARMYANADNLPDMSMSSFVDSLWSSFGIKFNYDAKTNVVTPRFIRDILRDKRDPIVMSGEAWTVYRNSEKITGFRLHYSNESEAKEQDNFIRKRVTDYDTSYDYQVEKSKYLKVMNKSYYDLSNSLLTVNDEHCYVDLVTGNAYRVKINKEALDDGDVNKLQPSLFQVAQWHGVEIGDCSEENSDYVIDMSIEFVPVDQNDVNWGRGRQTAKLCPFADDDMWNEEAEALRISPIVDSNITTVYCIDEVIQTDEKYDLSGTDDANSPLQSHDWGNAICMMRGGGADAYIDYYDYDYDGFGSAKIRAVAGGYTMDSDSISVYGEEYDYNGQGDGYGEIGYYYPYDGFYTRAEAGKKIEYILAFLPEDCNMLAPSRWVTAEAMRLKGWNDVQGDHTAVHAQVIELSNVLYLVTPIMEDGTILSPDELKAYIDHLTELYHQGKGYQHDLDANDKRIFLNIYSNEEFDRALAQAHAELLRQLYDIYFGDSIEVHNCAFPTRTSSSGNGIGEGERFSLKIRAFHTNPKTGEIMCNNDRIARRGLYDRFMSDYAHFVLNRKKVTVTGIVNVIDIKNIQWDRRYNIGGVIGWINKISTHISLEKGIEKCTFEMYVL